VEHGRRPPRRSRFATAGLLSTVACHDDSEADLAPSASALEESRYRRHVDDAVNPYERLRPPLPPAPDELCTCPAGTPLKLMSTGGLGFNPIHCLECNLEVSPERLGLDRDLADAIADWLRTYGAIDALELQSGDYEQWARTELLNPDSSPNQEGLELVRRLNELVRTYFWVWQPQSDEYWQPPASCPVCGGVLVDHNTGLFPQLLCERDSVVVVGG
jgi:hypothetical protein